MSEARHWLEQKQTLQALVVLQELCEQNRDYPELRQAIGAAVDPLIEEYFAAGQDAAARELVDQLAARYADHEVVVTRRQQLISRAEAYLQAARVASEGQRWREAHDAILTSLFIWPDLPETQRLAQELNARYPLVRVGVRDLDNSAGAADWAPEWSTLRDRRLTARSLFETLAAMPDGVEYYSPLDTAERKPSWLAFPFSRPSESAETGTDRWGPYRQVADESGEKRFVAESHFFAAREQQPREIIECKIDSTVDALRALDQRRILVFDRVAPWDLAVARAHPRVELVRYAAPHGAHAGPQSRSPLMTSGLVRSSRFRGDRSRADPDGGPGRRRHARG